MAEKNIEEVAKDVGFSILPEDMNDAIANAQAKIDEYYRVCDDANSTKEMVITAADTAITAMLDATNLQAQYSNQLALLLGKISDELESNEYLNS